MIRDTDDTALVGRRQEQIAPQRPALRVSHQIEQRLFALARTAQQAME